MTMYVLASGMSRSAIFSTSKFDRPFRFYRLFDAHQPLHDSVCEFFFFRPLRNSKVLRKFIVLSKSKAIRKFIVIRHFVGTRKPQHAVLRYQLFPQKPIALQPGRSKRQGFQIRPSNTIAAKYHISALRMPQCKECIIDSQSEVHGEAFLLPLLPRTHHFGGVA